MNRLNSIKKFFLVLFLITIIYGSYATAQDQEKQQEMPDSSSYLQKGKNLIGVSSMPNMNSTGFGQPGGIIGFLNLRYGRFFFSKVNTGADIYFQSWGTLSEGYAAGAYARYYLLSSRTNLFAETQYRYGYVIDEAYDVNRNEHFRLKSIFHQTHLNMGFSYTGIFKKKLNNRLGFELFGTIIFYHYVKSYMLDGSVRKHIAPGFDIGYRMLYFF